MIEHHLIGDLYTESCSFYLFNKFYFSCTWYPIFCLLIYGICFILAVILIIKFIDINIPENYPMKFTQNETHMLKSRM